MKATRFLTGAFGGSYLGVIAVKAPSMLGYSYRPTQKVELVAAVIGMMLACFFSYREQRREKKAKEPIKFGR